MKSHDVVSNYEMNFLGADGVPSFKAKIPTSFAGNITDFLSVILMWRIFNFYHLGVTIDMSSCTFYGIPGSPPLQI